MRKLSSIPGMVLLLVLMVGSAWLFWLSNPNCFTSSAQVSRRLSLEQSFELRFERGLSLPQVCSQPVANLEEGEEGEQEPRPDHPGEAVVFRNQQLLNDNGVIPPDGLVRAQQHLRQMPPAAPLPRSPAANSPDSAQAGWTWLGPGNIGGRIRTLLIHPTIPNLIFAGSVGGGLWKTTDGGASWAPVDDFMANLAVATLAIDPLNPATLYAGTGEGFYNGDGLRGAGIFKSTDGGITWNQLSSTTGEDFYFVNRLAISPDGTTLLAATHTGIFRSTDGGGVWTRVNASLDWLDLDFNPSDSTRAVSSGYSGKVAYSTDGGQTWTPATGISGSRVEIAYARSSPSIVYASVDSASGRLYKSTDGGQSYGLVNTGTNYLASQGWYDNALWVSPVDPNVVIVGGVDLYRSTNGGVSLIRISSWSTPNSAHADNHTIANDPNFDGVSNNTVYFGNDGGVYKAANVATVAISTGWTKLNNNLGITQFYGAAGNLASGKIVGGTQDNGTLLYSTANGPQGWTSPFGGDGGWSGADQTNSNYFYGEYIYAEVHRSSNGGTSSSFIYSGISEAGGSSANFIAPFVIDPNFSHQRMLVGAGSLWRTNNVRGANPLGWTAIKANISSPISAIAVAVGNSDIIWVGHDNGAVYKTTNGTDASPTWTKMDDNPTALPNRWVGRIAIDPTDSNKVYVTFAGYSSATANYSANNVWRSTDGGATWTNLSGAGDTALPNAPVRSLVVHPNDPNLLYAGTEVGVVSSTDGGSTWTAPSTGPANVSVDELFWMGCKLVAVSHGRGLFTSDQGLGQPCLFHRTAQLNGATGLGASPLLSWVPSTGASSYEYCLDTTNDNTCNGWTSVLTNTNVTPGGLMANTTYYWHVRALNQAGTLYADGSPNAYWSFTTSGTNPGAFAKAAPDDASGGAAANPTLSWDASAGAVSYEYCYDTTNDGVCTAWTSVGTNTSAGLSGLSPDTTYYWQARAFNADGFAAYADGSPSAFRSFTTGSAPGPFNRAVPLDAGTGQPAGPTLAWSASAGASAYEYCLDTTNDNACSGWTSRGTSLSAPLAGLAPDTTYYWHVRALNDLGFMVYADGPAGAYWSFTTGSAPTAFGHTSPAAGATGLPANLALTWSASPGASGYEYCYDTTDDGACSNWTSSPLTATTVISAPLNGLSPATTYFWQVRALNGLGYTTYADGLASAFWNFTTGSAPGAFNKSAPADAAPGLTPRLVLTWDPSAGAASYEYCFDTVDDNNCTPPAVWINAGTNTRVAPSGLAIDTYYWQVRALNPNGMVYANDGAWQSFTTQLYKIFLSLVARNTDPAPGGSPAR